MIVRKYWALSLTVLIAAMSGFFAGRYQHSNQELARGEILPLVSQNHDVSLFVMKQGPNPHGPSGITIANFLPIIDDIQANVLPEVWENDPQVRLQPYVSKLAISVTGNDRLQGEVSRYLQKRRDNQRLDGLTQ